MPESVAKIQQSTTALLRRLEFIGRHHLCLVAAGALNGIGQRGTVTRDQRFHIGLQPFEERQVADQSILDDLRQASRQFTCRQRLQGIRIRQHQLRLPEGTDHVFAARVIDTGLAADRRIDLCQQRRRHLNEGHTALVRSGGEAGQVADHTTAQGNDRRATVAALGEQGVEDMTQRLPVLELLAIGQHDLGQGHARSAQRYGELLQIQRRDCAIADDDRTWRPQLRSNQLGMAEQAATNMDGIGALAQTDIQAAHRLRTSRSISFTM